MSRLLKSKPHKVPRGFFVFQEGDSPKAAYRLDTGLVKLMKVSPQGTSRMVGIVTPGQLFGLVALLDERPYPVTAITLQPSQITSTSLSDFERLMRSSKMFSREVHRQVGEHHRHTQTLLTMGREPVEKRIVFLILLLVKSLGPTLRMGREDLAEMAGTTPETVIRTLTLFRKQGWIKTGWRSIQLIRKPDLAQVF